MADIFNMADTWNAGGTTFTAIKMNVTDTASAAGSLLMDLQVGGASKFSVRKDGVLALASYASIPEILTGNLKATDGSGFFQYNSATLATLTPTTLAIGGDVALARDAANVLAQRNGATAQASRLYNTYTDASNYERLVIEYASNVARIYTTAAGTGTARNLALGAGAIRFNLIAATGHLLAEDDNSYDIGAAGANRPRNVFIAGYVAVPEVLVGNLKATDGSGFLQYNSASLATLTPTMLAIGGATSSFPSLKRSATVLQARLADDSAFAPLQGNLRTQANAVAEVVVATHTMIITDAGGTAYRVLCVV